MKNTVKNILVTTAAITTLGLMAPETQAAVILADDFSSNTLETSNLLQNDLGDGLWHHGGAWSVGGGVLSASGDTDTAASEGGIIQAVAVGGATDLSLRLSFDYTLTAPGESLSVFLYGTKTEVGFNSSGTARMLNHGHVAESGSGRIQYLESVDGQDPAFVSSVEFVGGLTISDSPPTSYMGEITGQPQYSYFAKITGGTSGTFNQTVDLSQWGLAVEDFDYINVAFARDAVAGSNVTIDNLSLSSFTIPEPSSIALLIGGAAMLVGMRKRMRV